MKQTSLFDMPTVKVEEAPKTTRSAYMPEVGDEVLVRNITAGKEGEVIGKIQYIDHPNLFNDWSYPIQLWLPKLNMMVRSELKNIKRKR